MVNHTEDLITWSGSTQSADAGDDIDCSLNLGLTVDHNTTQPVLSASTSEPIPHEEIVFDDLQSPTPPPGVIVQPRPMLRRMTCRMCGRTYECTHWRNLRKEIVLEICNICYFKNQAAEKEARREAEAAGFGF